MMCFRKRGMQGGLVQVYILRNPIQGVYGWYLDTLNRYPRPTILGSIERAYNASSISTVEDFAPSERHHSHNERTHLCSP
jgi:hypothetical protein